MNDFQDLTAIVLAGGLGTRLRSVMADRPKVLAPVAGRPFLERLLQQVADAGIRKTILCTGHLGEQVQETFGDSFGALKLFYSKEAQPLGTAGALRLALPQIKSEWVLAMNGDSFCDVNLQEFDASRRRTGATGSLVIVQIADTRRHGSVAVAENGRVTGFIEKQADGGTGWINAGIYLLHRSLLQGIPANRAVSIEMEMFPAWTKGKLFAFKTTGKFLDIGTPESFAVAEKFFTEVKP